MIRTTAFALLALGLASSAQAQTSTSVCPSDEYFAMKAYCSGLTEIALSQLGEQKATDPEIKKFSKEMVKEHTECNSKIAKEASKKGIALPTSIDAVHTAALKRLASLSGSDFDKAYMMAQIGAHKDAVHLFEHEAYKGEDSDLKELASKTAPHLMKHTKMAFEVAGEKKEYEKYHKVMSYAKQVMDEK